MDEVSFGYVLKGLALPPGGPVLLALLGLLVSARARRTGLTLAAVGLASLWLLSLPATARWLAAAVETVPALTAPEAAEGVGAIVVLGASRYPQAPEYDGRDMAGARLLQRLQYAAHLHARTGLPLLVSGGRLGGWATSEAVVMREVLQQSFLTPVRWLEEQSLNTEQNARFSAEILAREGIGRVYVVTHALHMPRALESFRRAGLEAVPAPTAFSGGRGVNALVDWLPDAQALWLGRDALHEIIGRLWYRVRHAPRTG